MVRKKEHMFEKKYLTPLGQRILHFLSLNEGEEFHLRDLASRLGRSPSGCHSAIRSLLELEYIKKRESGRNLYLSIKGGNPSIVPFKVFMNVSDACSLIYPLRENIQKGVLYGSCCRGDDTIRSDIDIFMIANDKEGLLKILKGYQIAGRLLDLRIVDPTELINMREVERPFLEEVDKGIVIWSMDDEGV